MPRRISVILVTAAVGAAATPAVGQAAETYTVDAGAAAPGCVAKVCKTVIAAVGVVADGDTIIVKPGTYKETGKITLTKKNVLIQGTAGKTTIYPAASAATGDPTFTLIQGNVLDGITVATAANAGPAVLVTGRDTVFKNGAILRLVASTDDAAAYAVDPTVGAGTSTLKSSTIINGPAGATTQTQPAVLGNATSTLAIADSLVISGAGNGPAVGLVGNDKNADSSPIANTVTRSTLVAQKPASDALTVTSPATDALKKAVTLDSIALLAGASGAGLKVATLGGALPGQDTAGDVKVIATHVTVAGGDKPFAVSAASSGQTAAGNVDVTFDRSIVHGKSQGTVTSFTPAIPISLLGGVANTARVTVSTSDTTQNAVGAAADNATVTVPGKMTTPDDQLFVNLAKLNVHLRATAPVIDKGGAPVGGESTTDFEGQPRLAGAATDLGADEFLNLKPTASAVATPVAARQGDTITFDGSKSTDPEGASGGGIAKYRWFFGDGSTQETTTPAITHVYSQLGIYNATLTVVDTGGAASTAVAIPTVLITDGTPPVVKLTSPAKNKAFKIFATKKVKQGKKTVTTTTLDKKLLAKVLFTGTATDATPVKSVELSIRRVSITKKKTTSAAAAACVYLDGKTTFKASSCKKPVFFVLTQKNGAFSYKLKSTLKPKAGVYEVSARATDAGGSVSKPVTVRFVLK
ncbi:MAG: hypothetical protein JWO02_1888 [Solirubrobacterales bacterium]|nr:hypothetical protein [Solirubrobacterales bacterium]